MIVLIANPASGGGKGGRLLAGAREGLRALGKEHRVVVSEDGEHPERAAREAAAQGTETIVSMGGDGLINACANGVLGSETALAIVPTGGGNDFARCLGLDVRRPLSNLALLDQHRRRAVDVVRAEGPGWQRHFVCVGGAGFDSETNAYANTLTRLQGTPRYVWSVMRTLARFRPGRFVLRVDGTEHRMGAMMVGVANAPAYGGGMRICPEASIDDGVLDVCVVGDLPKLRFVAAFPRVFRGTHVTHPAVTMLRGEKIELDATPRFPVYADGEHLGSLPVTFTVVPRALEVVAP